MIRNPRSKVVEFDHFKITISGPFPSRYCFHKFFIARMRQLFKQTINLFNNYHNTRIL